MASVFQESHLRDCVNEVFRDSLNQRLVMINEEVRSSTTYDSQFYVTEEVKMIEMDTPMKQELSDLKKQSKRTSAKSTVPEVEKIKLAETPLKFKKTKVFSIDLHNYESVETASNIEKYEKEEDLT
jgi:hypothetical protein